MTDHVRSVPETHLVTATQIPSDFVINAVPERPGVATRTLALQQDPDLGPLTALKKKTFTGVGFNTIFRPQFPTSPAKLPFEVPDSDNILELNVTIETLSFQAPLGSVPNRGRLEQDIFLNGVPYLQTVSDVTDPNLTTAIHLEPGLFVIVPPTEHPAVTEPTIARMASIPHGTTINAQGGFIRGITTGPRIDPVDITPFVIGNPTSRIPFDSQTVANQNTPRIPQDLSIAPTITQQLLDNPNQMLLDHIAGMTILSTDVIFLDTKSATIPGGGTDNIGFLVGDAAGPNADAVEMSAIFWIEIVEAQIEVDPCEAGQAIEVKPTVPAGAPAPTFRVKSATARPDKTTHTVTYTQIQYTQNVSLDFQGLTWPHVSVATLVPADPIRLKI
ncbi:hypothetical protein BH09ACT7_BH09ACT7_24140 [soil metagenome]